MTDPTDCKKGLKLSRQGVLDVGDLVMAAISVLNHGYDKDLLNLNAKVGDKDAASNTKDVLREAAYKAAKALGWTLTEAKRDD